MNYEVVTIGAARRLDGGVAVGSGEAGVWVEEDTARVVVDEDVRAWVKRGTGQQGWLSDGQSGVYTTKPVEGDIYILGDSVCWQITPEEILAGHVTSGNGAIVRFLRPATVTPNETMPTVPKQPFGSRLRDMQSMLKARLPHRQESQVFVVHGQDENVSTPGRKRLMITGVATIVLVLGLAGLGHFRKSGIERSTSSQNIQIEAIVASYREAKAVVEMNPERSKQLLAEVQANMSLLEGEYAQDERLVEVREGMGGVLGAASGANPLVPTQLINLGLLREGMEGARLAMGDGVMWVLDAKGGRVVKVNLATGAGDVMFAQTSFGSPRLLSWYPGKIYVFGEKGISECILATLVCTVAVGTDAEWAEISDMGVWAGNIYLLDSGKLVIWKYPVIETGFGAKQSWLSEESVLQLGGGKRLTIDGSLWTMASRETMAKITRGVSEQVALSGIDKPLGGQTDIFTTDSMENIYLLDREQGRIVKVTKSGEYMSLWTDDRLKSAADFVVDEKVGKVWWVSGNVVWESTISS